MMEVMINISLTSGGDGSCRWVGGGVAGDGWPAGGGWGLGGGGGVVKVPIFI